MRSNPDKEKGIQNRRDVEAEMLNTYDWDLDKLPKPEYLGGPKFEDTEFGKTVLREVIPQSFIDSASEQLEQVFPSEIDTLTEVLSWEAEHSEEFMQQIRDMGLRINTHEVPPVTQEFIEESAKEYFEANNTVKEDLKEKLLSKLSLVLLLPEGTKILENVLDEANREVESISESHKTHFFQTLDQIRQRSFGITRYIWRSRGDDKVRPTHAQNNGKIFSWNVPPETGHPGDDFGCRCRAEPSLRQSAIASVSDSTQPSLNF